MATPRPPAITLTDNAKARLAQIMAEKKQDNVIGLRIGVTTKGCSGKSYKLDYATEEKEREEIITLEDGTKLFIEPSALLYLLGSTMDYITDDMGTSRFDFINPNEKGRCGCGESFMV